MAKRKIVDAHHHLWDLGRGYNYPWLQNKPSGEGMLGDLKPIARDYLLRDYRADTANYDLVGSVHVEAVPADPVIETRWLQATTNSDGLPSAIVAGVELQKADAERVIAEHVSFPNVRGIRQIVNWHKNAKYTFTGHDFLTTMLGSPASACSANTSFHSISSSIPGRWARRSNLPATIQRR